MADEVDQDGDVGRREPHAGGDAVDDLDADRGVIAGEPLADVVQEGADEEEVGSFDRVGELGGQRGGFQEMTVDGEGVIGVALGLVADGGPLGDEPHQQAVLVERLDLVDGGAAEGEQVDEGGARLVRPRVARWRHAVGQAVQRSAGDGAVQLGGRGRQPKGERRRRPRRGRAESGRSRRRPRPCRARGPLRAERSLWSGAPRRKRRFGGGLGSHSRRRRQTSSLTQAICRPAVETANMSASASRNPSAAATWSWSCRRSLSCSRWASRCSSTRMSVRSAVALVERIQVGVVGQQGGEDGDGAQHADVAQPAVALLQVGFEEEGDVAGRGAAFRHLLLEQGQVPGAEPVAPGGAGLLEERLGHPRLAPDEPAVEQAERHPHVLGGHAEHLGGAADGVVEVHALVPDGVPDGVGDLPDVPVAVVDEHHVEVAVGAERTAGRTPRRRSRARWRLTSPAARSARPESQASASAA